MKREPESVIDGARGYFVVTHQAREDGQPSRIARRPAPWTLLIVLQIPDGLRIGTIFSAAANCVVGFIHHAGVAIDHDYVLITAARAV